MRLVPMVEGEAGLRHDPQRSFAIGKFRAERITVGVRFVKSFIVEQRPCQRGTGRGAGERSSVDGA